MNKNRMEQVMTVHPVICNWQCVTSRRCAVIGASPAGAGS